MSDIWGGGQSAGAAAAAAVEKPEAPAMPSWKWDDDKTGPNCALRRRATGETILVVMHQADHFWGIYQPRYKPPQLGDDGKWRSDVDLDLIQIRGTRDAAREASLEMAWRTGWIE